MHHIQACVIAVVITMTCGGVAPAAERLLPTGDGYSVRSIAVSHDGKLFATGHGTGDSTPRPRGHVKLWNLESGKQIGILEEHFGAVDALAFSPDAKTLVAGGATLKIWDVESRKCLRTLPQKSSLIDLALSPDGTAIVTCHRGDKAAYVRDPATGKTRVELSGHLQTVASVSFSADGRTLATSSYDGSVILWEAATWKQQQVIRIGVEGATIRFSPVGRRLFVSGRQRERDAVWDPDRGVREDSFQERSGFTASAAFSMDGKLIATADYTSVTLRDAGSGDRLARIDGEVGKMGMSNVDFSRDGRFLILGDRKDDDHTMVRIVPVAKFLKQSDRQE